MKKRKEGWSVVARFWLNTIQDDSCWEWDGSKSDRGYPIFWDGSKNVRAHRFSYELHKGPIPEGMTLDHLCRNRGCVNPAHLEAVTQGVNTLRGEGVAARNAKKTNCPSGHPYTPENTKYQKSGARVCRTCHRLGNKTPKARERKLRWQRLHLIGPRIEPPRGISVERSKDGRLLVTDYDKPPKRGK